MTYCLLQATEHMIGCVLCSPGCFSLFRGKGLMDDNVMRKYTTRSDEARHYVQYDQGNIMLLISQQTILTVKTIYFLSHQKAKIVGCALCFCRGDTVSNIQPHLMHVS